MLPNEITECPYCGSKESYSYILTIKGIQTLGFYTLDKNSEDHSYFNDGNAKTAHGACRCDNCKKVIRAT